MIYTIMIVLSLILTVIWDLLVIYVIPSERLSQIFWERSIINVVITYIGILGFCLSSWTFYYNHKKKKKEVTPLLSKRITFNYMQLLNTYKTSLISKTLEDYNYLSFFSTMCVSLGFLGTVLGLAGGISNLSSVFIKSTDLANVKDNVFTLISNLGIAFDSTLLGLFFSIVIALLISFFKRFELKDIETMFDKKINHALLRDDLVIETAPSEIKFPEMNSEHLKVYAENMQSLSGELQQLTVIQKDFMKQISGNKEMTTFLQFFKNVTMYLDFISKALKKQSQPRSFKITEHSEE